MVESFAFRAFCKSVWLESVPEIPPQTALPPLLLASVQSKPVGEVDDALKNIPSIPGPTLAKVFEAVQ